MSDMSPEELAALYNAPAARVGPEAEGPAPAWAPDPPWEPEPPPAQQPRQPRPDPLETARAVALADYQRQNDLAALRYEHERALEEARYQQAMAQLRGPPPPEPTPLNRPLFSQKRGFLIGFVFGAVTAGVLMALSAYLERGR